MVRYKTKGVIEVMEKALKTWEKTRLYQAIRRYEKYDKNIIYLPRQYLEESRKSP